MQVCQKSHSYMHIRNLSSANLRHVDSRRACLPVLIRGHNRKYSHWMRKEWHKFTLGWEWWNQGDYHSGGYIRSYSGKRRSASCRNKSQRLRSYRDQSVHVLPKLPLQERCKHVTMDRIALSGGSQEHLWTQFTSCVQLERRLNFLFKLLRVHPKCLKTHRRGNQFARKQPWFIEAFSSLLVIRQDFQRAGRLPLGGPLDRVLWDELQLRWHLSACTFLLPCSDSWRSTNVSLPRRHQRWAKVGAERSRLQCSDHRFICPMSLRLPILSLEEVRQRAWKLSS